VAAVLALFAAGETVPPDAAWFALPVVAVFCALDPHPATSNAAPITTTAYTRVSGDGLRMMSPSEVELAALMHDPD
jgi:hypothetical protein